MWICIYIMHMFIESPYCSYYVAIQSGFRGSTGLVMGTDYHPNRCSWQFRVSSSGFGFGCTGLHLIRIHPVAIPTHFLRGADGLWALNPSRMFLFFNYICCGGIFTFYTSRLCMNSANYHVSTQKYTLVWRMHIRKLQCLMTAKVLSSFITIFRQSYFWTKWW